MKRKSADFSSNGPNKNKRSCSSEKTSGKFCTKCGRSPLNHWDGLCRGCYQLQYNEDDRCRKCSNTVLGIHTCGCTHPSILLYRQRHSKNHVRMPDLCAGCRMCQVEYFICFECHSICLECNRHNCTELINGECIDCLSSETFSILSGIDAFDEIPSEVQRLISVMVDCYEPVIPPPTLFELMRMG